MDEARKNQLRALIKSKTEELSRKVVQYQATRTPEIDAEFQGKIDEIASSLRVTQIGPNEYAVTALSEGDEDTTEKEPSPFSIEAGLIFRGHLTKGVMLALPEGSIVQSNTYNESGKPFVVEKVGSVESREDFWKHLRSLRVTNKTVNVWRDLQTYQHFERV